MNDDQALQQLIKARLEEGTNATTEPDPETEGSRVIPGTRTVQTPVSAVEDDDDDPDLSRQIAAAREHAAALTKTIAQRLSNRGDGR